MHQILLPLATPVSITSIGSFSPLGHKPESVWESYLNDASFITTINAGEKSAPGAALSGLLKQEAEDLKNSSLHYKNLDDSVLFAILASRSAAQRAGWGA
ncbi:MAG: beta-ketoacyl synthase, partial [Sphingobacteriales bacterium]